MRKPDELAFYAALRAVAPGPFPYLQPTADVVRATAERLGIHRKRAGFLLLKWTDRGLWEYGTTPFGGRFEDDAPATLNARD